jgi:membrane-bound metal-dependent hydrolase YbcI (DUF457 family)
VRRKTHIAVGAALSLPVALGLSTAAAAGAVFLGMAGSVVPDYADSRSALRRLLKHRGFSHSLIFALIAFGAVFLLFEALSQVDDASVRLQAEFVIPFTAAFAIGLLSHLGLDACTHGGICPGLPFVRRRCWLLPRPLRCRTGGTVDALTGFVATVGIVAAIATGAVERFT